MPISCTFISPPCPLSVLSPSPIPSYFSPILYHFTSLSPLILPSPPNTSSFVNQLPLHAHPLLPISLPLALSLLSLFPPLSPPPPTQPLPRPSTSGLTAEGAHHFPLTDANCCVFIRPRKVGVCEAGSAIVLIPQKRKSLLCLLCLVLSVALHRRKYCHRNRCTQIPRQHG